MPDKSQIGSPVALFTQQELAEAFSLVLPHDRAVELARKWFEMFTGDHNLDNAGRYLYTDWRDDAGLREIVRSQPAVVFAPVDTGSATGAGMYDWLVSMSPEEVEKMLLSFSDIHLDLAALSSPHLKRQVELIRQPELRVNTELRCKELRRALDQRHET